MLKQPALGGRRPLVQFRAGKMTFRDGMVYPENNLGLVTVVQGSGMIDLIWTASGKPDEMSVITRGSAQFNRVEKCTSGRVFVLQLNGASTAPNQCRFFWMQDPNEEKDADVLRKVRHAIGQRDVSAAAAARATAGGASSNTEGPISSSAFASILASLGQPVPATTTAAAAAASPASPVSPANATTGSSNAATLASTLQSLQQSSTQQRLDLQAVLGSNELRAALLEDPAYYLSRIESHLPPPPPTGDSEGIPQRDVLDEVRNNQASASAAVLQAALSDSPAAFREVVSAFGLNTIPTGVSPGTEIGANAFIGRVQASNPPREEPSSNAAEEDTKKEEGKAEEE